MATTYFEIPLGNIQPAKNIMQLLNGTSQIGIANPWFDIPGVSKPTLMDFMKVEVKTTKQGQCPTIHSPLIVAAESVSTNPKFKASSQFTSNVIFTEDKGEKYPTLQFRLFSINFNKGEDRYTRDKFKSIQMIPSARVLDEFTTHECVLNYQLTQAFEFCLIAKILGIDRFQYSSNGVLKNVTTDQEFIEMISCRIALSPLKPLLENYIGFLASPKPYIPRFMGMEESRTGTYNDLLWILRDDLLKYAQTNNVAYASAILTCSLMKPAVYVNKYKPKAKPGVQAAPQPERIGCKADYNFTFSAEGYGSKQKTGPEPARVITPEDHRELAGKQREGKVYVKIDFDYRVNAPDTFGNKDKNVMRLRYIVKSIAHRPSASGAGADPDMDDIFLGDSAPQTEEDMNDVNV